MIDDRVLERTVRLSDRPRNGREIVAEVAERLVREEIERIKASIQ